MTQPPNRRLATEAHVAEQLEQLTAADIGAQPAGTYATPADVTNAVAGKATAAAVAEALAGKADLSGGKLPESQVPTRLGDVALKAAYVSSDGTPRVMKATGDTRAGVLDWEHDGDAGYVQHFRIGPDTTVGAFFTAYGLDRGSGGAILLALKNAGAGIQLDQHRSGSMGIYAKAFGANPIMYAEMYRGSGGIMLEARNGQGFADGVTTQGSTTFTSATAAFSAGDVGQALVQTTSRGNNDPIGTIPAGTTIVSVTNATTVVLSQAATATSTGLLFRVAGTNRAPDTSLPMLTFRDTDQTTILGQVRRGALDWRTPASFATNDVAQQALKASGKTGQTAEVVSVYKAAGDATAAVSVNSGGRLIGRNGNTFTNTGDTAQNAATILNGSSTTHSLLIQAATGQTLDQISIQSNGGGATQSRFDKAGYFMTRKTAAPADGDLATGEVAFWFDSTTGAAKLMVKGKDAGGTVRTAAVALA